MSPRDDNPISITPAGVGLHKVCHFVSGAWRQTAHWHVQGCVGKAVSPRRRVVTQKLLGVTTRRMHKVYHCYTIISNISISVLCLVLVVVICYDYDY